MTVSKIIFALRKIMNNKYSLTLVFGCYKEGENLKKILPETIDVLTKNIADFEILVIDTSVPLDNTKEICAKFPEVKYLNRTGGDSYGSMFRTAIKEATKQRIAFMDADGSHKITDLLKMYDVSDKYPLVIGSRYTKGGKSDNPFFLRLQSHILNIAFRYLLGIKAKDISNSMRIYDVKMLKNIELKADNFDILQEVLIKLKKSDKHFKIKEVSIHFHEREKGVSHRKFFPFLLSFSKTFICLFKIRWFD